MSERERDVMIVVHLILTSTALTLFQVIVLKLDLFKQKNTNIFNEAKIICLILEKH